MRRRDRGVGRRGGRKRGGECATSGRGERGDGAAEDMVPRYHKDKRRGRVDDGIDGQSVDLVDGRCRWVRVMKAARIV